MKKFSQEIVEFIRQNAKGVSNKEITELVNKTFKTNYLVGQIENLKARYKISSGLTGYFEKGHTTHNKGKKWSEYMSVDGQKQSLKTCFKKGNIPKNHRTVGSERINKDGYIEIKVAEPNKWKLKHRLIYENTFGSIPKSHKVIFADGNKYNLEIDNLILVSSSEELLINRNDLYFRNKELTKTGVMIAKVIDKTNKKRRNK